MSFSEMVASNGPLRRARSGDGASDDLVIETSPSAPGVSGGVDPRYFGGAKRFQGKVVFSRRPQSCQNGGSVGLVSGLSSVELSRRG